MTKKQRRFVDTFVVAGLVIGFLLVLTAIVSIPYQMSYGSVDNVKVEIVSKERITTKDSSKYLIFTKNEVFENTDSLLHMKWNSSDIYGKIEAGQTCDVKVNGYRVAFLSMYRNILEVKCNDQ